MFTLRHASAPEEDRFREFCEQHRETGASVWALWSQIGKRYIYAALPVVKDEPCWAMIWDPSRYLFRIDLELSGPEWFWRDRITKDDDGDDFSGELPERALALLGKLFKQ